MENKIIYEFEGINMVTIYTSKKPSNSTHLKDESLRSTYVISEHYPQFPDLVLEVNGVASETQVVPCSGDVMSQRLRRSNRAIDAVISQAVSYPTCPVPSLLSETQRSETSPPLTRARVLATRTIPNLNARTPSDTHAQTYKNTKVQCLLHRFRIKMWSSPHSTE